MQPVCQRCKEARATVLITDVPEKKVRHLCEECAAREGVLIKQSPQTTNAILQEFIKHKAGTSAADERTCPKCGMTFRDFRLKGMLGCPHDYEVFKPILMPLIERAHQGSTEHIGKAPKSAGPVIRKRAGIIKLRRELADAIEKENYERAAKLRDRIDKIDASQSSESTDSL